VRSTTPNSGNLWQADKLKVDKEKVYRLRDGTILGPFKLWPVSDSESHLTTDLGGHCWHPATGKETSGCENLDIIMEVHVIELG